MKVLLTALFSIVLVTALGCGKSTLPLKEFKNRINDDLKAQTHDATIELNLKNKDIDALIDFESAVLAYFAGPMAGSLTDMIVQERNIEAVKYKNEQVKIIHSALGSYDYGNTLKEQFSQNLDALSWINTNRAGTTKGTRKEGDLIITLTSGYKFSPEYTDFQAAMWVTVKKIVHQTATDTSKPIVKEVKVFENFYSYKFPAVDRQEKSQQEIDFKTAEVNQWFNDELEKYELKTDKKLSKGKFLGKLKAKKRRKLRLINKPWDYHKTNFKMAEFWSLNNAEQLKEMLNESASELSRMLLVDLNTVDRVRIRKKAKNNRNGRIRWFEVESSSERKLFRNSLGYLCSIEAKDDYDSCESELVEENQI